MIWEGVLNSSSRRQNLVRGAQVIVTSFLLTGIIFFTRTRSPELALTFYFLYAGPIVVAAYTWGKEVGGLLILAAVSFFAPIAVSAGPDADRLVLGAVEVAASAVLFGSLAVVGERAGGHRRRESRYRKLDRITERLNRELQVDELLEVILGQTLPLFGATGGEILLWNEQMHQLETAAAVGVSQEAHQYLQRRVLLEMTQAERRGGDRILTGSARIRETLADQILHDDKPFLHNQLEDDPRYVYCDGDTPLVRVRVKSVLAVPLRSGLEPFGLLGLFNKENGGFDQNDVELLTTIAEKSAITIENARLYRMTDANLRQRVEELSVLNRTAQMLASSLNLDQTIQTIVDTLQKLFPFAEIEICLWDPVNRVMRTHAWNGDPSYLEATGGLYRLGEGYTGWIAQHSETLWIPDTETRKDVQPKVDNSRFTICSYVGFPLKVGQQLIGTLEMTSDRQDDFPGSARSMLEALCYQAAIAIQNARLYGERQRRLAEMVGLQQISEAIGSVRDPNQTYSVLTERIAKSMNVEMCGVLLYDLETEALIGRPPFYGVPAHLIESYRIQLPQGSTIRQIWETTSYWYTNEILADPALAQSGLSILAEAAEMRATMFAALIAGGRRFGVLQVANKREGSPFEEGDARLLSILAHQTAVVLENARLYQTEKERRSMMEALQASATAMSAALDLGEVVQVIIQRARTTFRVDAVVLLLCDSLGQYLVIDAEEGFSTEFVKACRLPCGELHEYLRQFGTQPRLSESLSESTVIAGDLLEAEGMDWAVFAPFVLGGELLGALYFCGTASTRPWGADELELVTLFSNQATVAIGNAQLYTRTDERLRMRLNELTILNRIGQQLNATLDLEHILNLVLEEAVQATNATHGSVYLMNWETSTLKVRTAFGFLSEESLRPETSLSLEEGVIGRAAKTGQPIVVDDVTLDPDYVAIVPETCSELAVPIVHRGIVVGIINLESPQVSGFTEAHLEFLEALAGQAAVAINNARNYELQEDRNELMRQRAEQLSQLFEIGQTMRTERPLEEILTEIAFAVQETVGFNVAQISLREGAFQQQVAAAGVPIAEFERMRQVRQAWSNLEELIDEKFRVSNSYYVPFEQRDNLRSGEDMEDREPGQWHPADMLIAPLEGSSGKVLGLLWVDQPRSGKVPDRAMIEALEIFAAQAVLAVENAELLGQTRRQLQEMEAINEIGHALSAIAHLDELLGVLRKQLASLVPTESFYVALYDAASDQIMFPLFLRDDQPVAVEAISASEGLTGYILSTGTPLLLEADAPRLLEDRGLSGLGQPARSYLGVPMMLGDKAIGVIAVQDFETDYVFDEGHARALSTVAEQAAIAIQNAQLYDETVNRALQLSQLYEAARAISSELELDRVLQVLSQQLVGLLDATGCLIFDRDPVSETVAAVAEYPREWSANLDLPHRFAIDQFPVTAQVLNSRAVVQVHAVDLENDSVNSVWLDGAGVSSMLLLPLVAGDRIVGLVKLFHARHHPFSDAEVNVARTLANQGAVAIQNARLFEEVRSYRDELELRVTERTEALETERDRVETLYRVTRDLGVSLDLDRVLDRALSLILQTVQAERSSVFMLDHQTDRILQRASLWIEIGEQEQKNRQVLPRGGAPTHLRRGDGLAGWVMQNKQPAIIGDVFEDPRWVDVEGLERRHRSVLAVPLVVSDESLGALLLFQSLPGYFTHEHLRLVEAIASQVASAINNAQLYGYVFESAERLGKMIKTQQVETAKTEAILEGVADGVMVSDETGLVIRFNAAAESILNTPREQVLGRSTDELLGLYGASGAAWAKVIESWRISPPRIGEGMRFSELLEFEDRIVSVLLSPVVMQDEFLGTVSLFRDITREVAVDRAKSEFVSTVSHELRTPMTSIKGYADLLAMGAAGSLTEDQRHFLFIIKTNADRLTMLVNDLLDIGRIDTQRIELNIKDVELGQIAQTVIDSLRGKALEKGQTLMVDIPVHLPPVAADRDRLIQVLTNLISNAQQYTPTGGHIGVSAQFMAAPVDQLIDGGDTEQSGELPGEFDPGQTRQMIRIDVRDDGIGIAPEDRTRIFERFFRSDHPFVQETTGTGLGLSITRSLIEMHGGRIWVESEPGRGSVFHFTVPVAV